MTVAGPGDGLGVAADRTQLYRGGGGARESVGWRWNFCRGSAATSQLGRKYGRVAASAALVLRPVVERSVVWRGVGKPHAPAASKQQPAAEGVL